MSIIAPSSSTSTTRVTSSSTTSTTHSHGSQSPLSTESYTIISGTRRLTTTSTHSNATITSAHNGTTTQASGKTSPASHNSHTARTSTSSSRAPTNTQPCNGYTEFCTRKYSNITMVAAHNSPFVRADSLSANQALPVLDQLHNGIRMLQFESHYVNDTIYLCHTSCSLLNVGTLESYLTTVVQWLHENPYEVLTILMVNSDFINPANYTAPVTNSGLIDFVYTPPKIPMKRSDWPTLSDMILSGRRVVTMLDYDANQTAIPWLLEEFTQMWETPFSPTNRSFPCTEQRPPGLNQTIARNDYMYMANHNLNLPVNLAGLHILIPDISLLDQTNAVSGFGSLGLMANHCTDMWGHPPNFLLVDYYNYGNFNGSVFEVAAEMNGVPFRNFCCGLATSVAAPIAAPAPATFELVLLSLVALLSAMVTFS